MSMDMAVEDQEGAAERRSLRGAAEAAVGRLVQAIVDGQGLAEVFGVEGVSIDALEAQAYRFYQNRRYEQAVIAAQGVLALDKGRPISNLILGDVALSEYRFQEAVDYLTRAHELSPEEVEVEARLGEALLKSGQVEAARPHLESVVEALSDERSRTAQRVRAFLAHLSR